MADPIEYLDAEPSADPGVPDEDVVDTAPGNRRRTGRTVGGLAVVGLVVVGLLVARAATSGGRNDAAPSPTPVENVAPTSSTVAPSAMRLVLDSSTGRVLAAACAGDTDLPTQASDSGDGPPPVTDTGGTPAENGHTTRCQGDASSCPEADDGQNACSSDVVVARTVSRAVLQRFPTAQLASALTETVRENGRLWYRSLLYSLDGGVTLRVEVIQHHTDAPLVSESDSPAGRYSQAVARHGSLDVVVTTAGPSGSASTLDVQQELAASAALTSP